MSDTEVDDDAEETPDFYEPENLIPWYAAVTHPNDPEEVRRLVALAIAHSSGCDSQRLVIHARAIELYLEGAATGLSPSDLSSVVPLPSSKVH